MSVSVRCLLWGHEDLVRHTADRMFLECAECGRETSGWEVCAVGTARPSRDVEARRTGRILDIAKRLGGVTNDPAPSAARSLGKAA